MASLPTGTQLGPFQVDVPIARGGMGEVYKAVDRRLGRTVALKVLPREVAADPDRRRRLEREARIISNLSHPNICTLFDIGQDGDLWFLVMEHLEGETLESRLARGPLAIPEACRVAAEIAGALALAHSRGIAHRDLKPSNIMLTADGVKVLDFGIAKAWLTPVWPVAPIADGDSADSLTLEGTLLGTPPYMSPEQLRGDDITASSDIFAFGSLLFEMITGRQAFEGRTPADIVARVLGAHRPSLLNHTPPVPEGLERVVDRCLALSPDDRWASMAEVVEELGRLPLDTGDTPRRTSAARRVWVWAAAGVVALAGTAGLVQWMQPDGLITIAVLPFVNATGDASLDRLIEGISISVSDRLSVLPELRVTQWPSVSSPRTAAVAADPSAIATALGVDWVVTGNITTSGETLTATVDLVAAARERTPITNFSWTRGDDRAVSSEIARAAIGALALPIDGEGAERIGAQDGTPAAYLLGLSAFSRRELVEARHQFTIANDPPYAPASAGLASTVALFGTMGWDLAPPNMVVPEADELADNALALDPNLAEAHAAKAFVLRFLRDRDTARVEHQKSVDLNPSCATCHQWFASHYWTQNQFLEARAQLDEALKVDPDSAVLSMNVGRHWYYQGDYDVAITWFDKALQIDSRFWLAKQLIILSLVQQGKLVDARRAFDQLDGAPPLNRLVIEAYLLASEGHDEEAASVVAELQEQRRSTYLPPYLFAPIYAAMGDTDAAMDALWEAEAEGSGYLEYLGLEPTLDPVRTHPEFSQLLEHMKLEDFSARTAGRERPAA